MADSDAVRQRRARLRKHGGHSHCTDCCTGDKRPARTEVADAVRAWCADRDITDANIELYEVVAVRGAEEVDRAGIPGAQRALANAIQEFRTRVRHANYNGPSRLGVDDDQDDDGRKPLDDAVDAILNSDRW